MRVTQALIFLLLFLSTLAHSADMPKVALETSAGRIVLELDSQRAPTSVENFIDYVNSGFYHETVFHRVIEGFMIQGGGFTSKLMRKQTQQPIRNEANNGLKNLAYTIAMARTNAPHSATSQFFINTVDNSNLDHTSPTGRGWGYAVFGRVIEGFDVVDTIGTVATGPSGPFRSDVPREPIVIRSAEIINEEPEVGKAKEATTTLNAEDSATTTLQ